MVPLNKVKEIISKHDNLEKELSSGNIDPKLFVKKSKEYSSLGGIVSTARAYLNFESEKKGSFLGSAFKLGTELVAAVAVGTIIGFILDSWFDTKPWLIIIFFFLGTAAGILNVIRTANRMQKEE